MFQYDQSDANIPVLNNVEQKVDVVIPANVLDNYKGADNEVQAPVIKVLNQSDAEKLTESIGVIESTTADGIKEKDEVSLVAEVVSLSLSLCRQVVIKHW